jgi:hypothetical protein
LQVWNAVVHRSHIDVSTNHHACFRFAVCSVKKKLTATDGVLFLVCVCVLARFVTASADDDSSCLVCRCIDQRVYIGAVRCNFIASVFTANGCHSNVEAFSIDWRIVRFRIYVSAR